MNGVIGSARRISSTARLVSAGSARNACHCSGLAANSRSACDSCAWVVSIAAGDDVQDEVDALGVREPVTGLLGGQQRGQQIIARLGGTAGQQSLDVVVDLGRRLLELRDLRAERLNVELALDQAGPVLEPGRVRLWRTKHGRDRQRRVGLGDRRYELAAVAAAEVGPQPAEEGPHRRAAICLRRVG